MAQGYVLLLGFSLKAARLFVREQGLERPERLRMITDKIVNNICNAIR